MKTIDRVRVKRIYDDNPDTSWIGSYSMNPGAGAIDRRERGDWGRGENFYFNPANPEYAEQEYARMESIARGHVCFYGVRAEAQIIVDGTRQTLISGGLWGIESDSGADYFQEVAGEQLTELAAVLRSLDFDSNEIRNAFPKSTIGLVEAAQ